MSTSTIESVLYGKNEACFTDYVVSNVDAWQTFNELLDNKIAETDVRIKKLKTSFSAFAVYLGIGENLRNIMKNGKCATWYFTTYDVEKCYGEPMSNFI